MSESKFSKTVCGIITAGCGGHVSRVEAHASASGIPDLDFCAFTKEGHIELKVGTKQKPPELRAPQVRWFSKRLESGGSPFFLMLDEDDDMVYLIDGWHAHDLGGKKATTIWKSVAALHWQAGDKFRQGFIGFLRNYY